MTESVLKSIMRLFAIVGNIKHSNNTEPEESVYQQTREVTEAFLGQLVNPEQSIKYLQMFDFHYRNLQRRKSKKNIKRIALFAVKTLLICEQINNRLEIQQKTFVLLQILDILKESNNRLSEEALDYINTISDSFSISPDDYDLIYLFVFGSLEKRARNASFLIISGEKENLMYRHHMYRENMTGSMVVFYLARIQSYFFRHEEADDWLYMNGRSILYNRIYMLEKGTAIRCPKIHTIHYSDILGNFMHMKVMHDVQLTALNIEYSFTNSDNGIKPFSFVGKAGQLIGIMGGSGVGKSTLLSVLNGTLKPQKGRVLINGIDIYENRDKIQSIIGYIPQDDFLIEELTVYENLYFNARFCFSHYDKEKLNKLIDKVLHNLGLFEIRNLKVGSSLNKYISGGQRKRLNIALELLREPSVLFVDEPTSGLSSNDSEKVIDLLKQQSFSGKLVIVNIHQPSSDIFKMFDRLLVLDKGGRAIYYGNAIDSLVYFKTVTQLLNSNESECIWCGNLNPEQILQIVDSQEVDSKGFLTGRRMISPDEWHQLYLTSIDNNLNINPETKPIPRSSFNLPGKIRQFAIYSLRNLKSKLSDTQYLIINFLEAPLLAIILSFFTRYAAGSNDQYIFSENLNIPAFIFMSVVVSLFIGMMGSAEEIIRDAKLLKRESFLNLSKQSYLNSKVIYLFIVSAIQMVIYVLISHIILEIEGMQLSYWIILFSTACFANVLGLNLSAGLRSVVAIYISIPLLLIPQLLLSGLIVKFDKLHPLLKSDIYVPAIGDVMASRWAYEAIAVDQFKNNKYEKGIYQFEMAESDATFYSNYLIPELLNRVGACSLYYENEEKKVLLKNELPLIKGEIASLAQHLNISDFQFLDKINVKDFNDPISHELIQYLRLARNVSSQLLNRAIENKDNYTQQIENTLGSRQALISLKEKYHNTSLADQLLNNSEQDRLIQFKGSFYRKYEPIFNIPETGFGRAHFYAPVKRFGFFSIDTFWFNVMAIWFMTIALYITLSFNVLGRIVDKMKRTE